MKKLVDLFRQFAMRWHYGKVLSVCPYCSNYSLKEKCTICIPSKKRCRAYRYFDSRKECYEAYQTEDNAIYIFRDGKLVRVAFAQKQISAQELKEHLTLTIKDDRNKRSKIHS